MAAQWAPMDTNPQLRSGMPSPLRAVASRRSSATSLLVCRVAFAAVLLQAALPVGGVSHLLDRDTIYPTSGEAKDISVDDNGTEMFASTSVALLVFRLEGGVFVQRGLVGGSYQSSVVAVHQPSLLYATEPDRLNTIDFSDPAAPKVVGHVIVPQGISGYCARIAQHKKAPNVLYLGCHGDGIAVVDVTNKIKPEYLKHIVVDTARDTKGVTVDSERNRLFVCTGTPTGGVHMYDVSDARNPMHIGFQETTQSAYETVIRGTYLYVADAGDLEIYDTAGDVFVRIGACCSTGPSPLNFVGIALRGNYAVLSDFNRRVVVVDVADPQMSFLDRYKVTIDTGKEGVIIAKLADGVVRIFQALGNTGVAVYAPDLTPAPPTPAPDTPIPTTPAPPTATPTVAPTPAPDTPAPDTEAPPTPSPTTDTPDTPLPTDTPAPTATLEPPPPPPTPSPPSPGETPPPPTPATDGPSSSTELPETELPATESPAPNTLTTVSPAPNTPNTTSPFSPYSLTPLPELDARAPTPWEAVREHDADRVQGSASASVVGSIASSGGAAAVATRLVVVSGWCRRNGTRSSFPLSLHPTGLTVAGSPELGMVLGNVLITAGFALLCSLLVLAIERGGAHIAPSMIESLDAQGLLRFPSAPLFVFTLLYQGTSLGGMVLLLHPPNTWMFLVGAATMLVCCGVPLSVFYSVNSGVAHQAVYVLDPQGRSTLSDLVLGPGEWVNTSRQTDWVKRYASVMRGYREGFAWFLFFEFCQSFAIAGIHALDTDNFMACGHVKAATAAVFFVMLIIHAAMWPHARFRDSFCQCINLGSQCTAMILLAASYYSDDKSNWLFDVANDLLLITIVLLIIKAVLDMVCEARIIFTGRRKRLQEMMYVRMHRSNTTVSVRGLEDFKLLGGPSV